MSHDPARIRNVAVVGHRGSGKTSLVEALLFEAGAIPRLGSVVDGNTVCDFEEDERQRSLSISGAICSLDWHDRHVTLIDTPGDPSFQADAVGALGVVEGVVLEVNGVSGVEVSTDRLLSRCRDLGRPVVIHVSMMDRERASLGGAMAGIRTLSDQAVQVALPMGEGADFRGVIDLVHMVAFADPGGKPEGDGGVIPEEYLADAQELHDALLARVAESADELIDKYLEGEEITSAEMAAALKTMVARGELYPVTCGSSTRNSGTHCLLDLLIEALPSPKRSGPITASTTNGEEIELPLEGGLVAYVFKTIADPFAGRLSVFRVFSGEARADANVVVSRSSGKERLGALFTLQGKEHRSVTSLGAGAIGAVAKLKDVRTGDLLTDVARDVMIAPPKLPAPVVSVAIEPGKKGDDEKLASSLRRLQEEDPTLGVHRDERTGELLVEGLSQMHVEVTVDRLKRRFGVDAITHPPRVPYLEAIRRPAKGHGRHKKQTGGRGQFGDCHVAIEPIEGHVGYEFVDQIVGGVIPNGFRPAVDKGVQEAMQRGDLAHCPVVGVRVRLTDGSYHNVDSSEMAFKIAGSLAFKAAYAQADPVLLEPVMSVEIATPEASVGDITGDLSSRRGRLLGIEPRGAATVVRAEVPMAEMLTYSTTLTSVTGGRGDYSMAFLRYEEVPVQAAPKIIAELKKEHA